MFVVDQKLPIRDLQETFRERFNSNVPLAPYTSARVGGPAEGILFVRNRRELEEAVRWMWAHNILFSVLGGGSNILVSDTGVKGVVILNRARQIRFDDKTDHPEVWAESGANLGLVARQAALRGLGGLAWAAGIPGTVGGAVVGNAGAHGGDVASSLSLAEILQHNRKVENWPPERFQFSYRTSSLKLADIDAIVLAASFRLEHTPPEEIQRTMESYLADRRRTQPLGASMGSMFKNPVGDFAGRLIETSGLKGKSIGPAQISPLHANFFINHGGATAAEIYQLIQLARRKVADQSGIELELEVELVGEWPGGAIG